MSRQLLLDHDCQHLRLPAGAELICREGSLWLTYETRAQTRPSPDLVLTAGQRHRATAAGDYFVTHMRPGPPARCELVLPTVERRAWTGAMFSPR